MKGIPLKKTKKIDLQKAILDFVSNRCDGDGYKAIEPFAARFGSLRCDVASIAGCAAGLNESIDVLKNYLSVISILEDTFDHDGLKIHFPWTDALRPQGFEERQSLKWERVNVLYNLAALMSIAGCVHRRGDSAQLKTSIHHLQTAAGIFVYLKNVVMASYFEPATRDLHPPVISMHIKRLLAQAQICVYEKAASQNMTRSLLSKLALGASDLFKEAYDLSLQTTSGYLDPEIPAWLRIQQLCYRAAAEYQRACSDKISVEKESRGYGALISRLEKSSSLLKEAETLREQLNLPVDYQELRSRTEEWLKELHRENNIIYLEVVPDASTIPPLECAISAEPTVVDMTTLATPYTSATAVFRRIVPREVQAVLTSFDSRCRALLTDFQGTGKVMSERVAMLPPLPHTTGRNQVLSDDLWQTIQAVQLSGGVMAMEKTVECLNNSFCVATAELEELSAALNHRTYEPEGRTLSSAVSELQTKLKAAGEANAIIAKKVEHSKNMFPILQMRNRNLINAEAPEPDTTDQPANGDNGVNDEMRQCHGKIQTNVTLLTNVATQFANDLNKHSDELADQLRAEFKLLSMDLKSLEEKKFADLYTKCNSEVERLSTCLTRDMREYLALNEKYNNSARRPVVQQDKRSLFFRDLDLCAHALLSAFRESSEGKAFFTSLSKKTSELTVRVQGYISGPHSAADGTQTALPPTTPPGEVFGYLPPYEPVPPPPHFPLGYPHQQHPYPPPGNHHQGL